MNWWVRIDWMIVGYTDRERPPPDFVFRGDTILCSRQDPVNKGSYAKKCFHQGELNPDLIIERQMSYPLDHRTLLFPHDLYISTLPIQLHR